MGTRQAKKKCQLIVMSLATFILVGCMAREGQDQSTQSTAAAFSAPVGVAPITHEAHTAAFLAPEIWAGIFAEMKKTPTSTVVDGYLRAAARGNPVAHYLLGKMYETGKDVPLSADDAVKHYYAAAMAGYPLAQTAIAEHYESGKGVSRDLNLAGQWYALAAQQGEDVATGKVAQPLLDGQVSPEDAEKYLVMLSACAAPSAERNNSIDRPYRPAGFLGGPTCQFMMGQINERGIGVPVNMKRAIAWYDLSAHQGFPPAQERFSDLYKPGHELAHDENADYLVGYWHRASVLNAQKSISDRFPL